MDDRLAAEYPIWRIVLETPNSLEDVDSWGLRRVYDALAMLEMKQTYSNAIEAKRSMELDAIKASKGGR